ncbi:unnamed protein product, partial [marine sediment metagenome]
MKFTLIAQKTMKRRLPEEAKSVDGLNVRSELRPMCEGAEGEDAWHASFRHIKKNFLINT